MTWPHPSESWKGFQARNTNFTDTKLQASIQVQEGYMETPFSSNSYGYFRYLLFGCLAQSILSVSPDFKPWQKRHNETISLTPLTAQERTEDQTSPFSPQLSHAKAWPATCPAPGAAQSYRSQMLASHWGVPQAAPATAHLQAGEILQCYWAAGLLAQLDILSRQN